MACQVGCYGGGKLGALGSLEHIGNRICVGYLRSGGGCHPDNTAPDIPLCDRVTAQRISHGRDQNTCHSGNGAVIRIGLDAFALAGVILGLCIIDAFAIFERHTLPGDICIEIFCDDRAVW